MKIPFTQIRNQIRKYQRDSILDKCYEYLEKRENDIYPIWHIFLIMKWAYQHADFNYPPKLINYEEFNKILKLVYNFNNEHISSFLKQGKIGQGMQIFHSQQFYLQRQVYTAIFGIQLKLYNSIQSKHNVDKAFKLQTGISIFDFLYITHLIWIYIQSKTLKDNPLQYFGHISPTIINIILEKVEKETLLKYFELTVLKTDDAIGRIENFKRKLINEDLQIFETTFFTLCPFHEFGDRLKVIHTAVFNYFANYFVYDFLKSNDEKFTTSFGDRFEKYILLSLHEVFKNIIPEVELKKMLGNQSKLIDFCLPDEKVFIECKAIEIQVYPSVNPTENLLYIALKDSILKAYFEQLLSVSRQLNYEGENWGIILTYKELFWSDLRDLHELCKDKYSVNTKHLPPENVFIMDIFTWNLVINIIKTGQAKLTDILKMAKKNNDDVVTRKQLFRMHLDVYQIEYLDLDYLSDEIKQFSL